MVERRDLLKTLGLGGLGLFLGQTASLLEATSVSETSFSFVEVPSASSGISWVHTSGRSPEMYLPETVGAGCACFDNENDGWMDIYLVTIEPVDLYTPQKRLRNALYRNNRDVTFTHVTSSAGVPGGGYGMGVAVGDYNRDGFPDLFVT